MIPQYATIHNSFLFVSIQHPKQCVLLHPFCQFEGQNPVRGSISTSRLEEGP